MRYWPLLLVFVTAVWAWSAADQEIFRVNHEVKQDLGENVTFYSWLGLENGPKSTYEEINKAYRKLSRKIHPDKIKQTKFKGNSKKFKRVKRRATERFQRLGLVAEILRLSKKERYDFFLKNGFPKYRNNSWLYSKFRPSAGMVFVGLFFLVGVFQYLLSKVQHVQNRKRIETTRDELRRQAWPTGIPLDGKDRVLRNEFLGKTFVVKVDGSVYFQDPEDAGLLHLIDPDDCVEPSLYDTVLFKAPVGLWNATVGKLAPGARIRPPKRVAPSQKKITEIQGDTEYKGSHKATKKPTKEKRGEKTTLPNGKVIYTRKKNA